MSERLKEVPQEAYEHYEQAQVHLIQYMLLMGIIQDESEYVDSAEAFAMVADRTLTVPQKLDFDRVSENIDDALKESRERFQSLIHKNH